MRTRCVLVGLVGLVMSLLGVAPAGAAQAINVTPSANLVDGQVVTVSGSGFAPDAQASVFECGPVGEVDYCDQLTSQVVSTDSAGNFSLSYAVSRLVGIPCQLGQFIDCAGASTICVIAAADSANPLSRSSFPITFVRGHGPFRPDIIVKNRATGEFSGDEYYDPTGGGVQRRHHAEVNGSWTFAVVVQNDGASSDSLIVSAPSVPGIHIQYFMGIFDITAAVTNGAGFTVPVGPFGSFLFAVRESGLPGGISSPPDLVTVRSSSISSLSDAVSLTFDPGAS